MMTFSTVDTPLRYQASQYCCVVTTTLNGISCLIKRNDLPAEVPKALYCFCLDSIDKVGNINGSSIHSIELIAQWITSYKSPKFNVEAVFRYGRSACATAIEECINEGGVAVLEVQVGRFWHYILAMGHDKEKYYCFDPYYRRMIRGCKNNVELIESNGFKPNLSIKKNWFRAYRKNKKFCHGSANERVIITLNRRD